MAGQVLWVSVGASAWLSTKSDQFYVNMALRSSDDRYDGKRPRLRVRHVLTPFFHPLTTQEQQKPCTS